MGGVLCKGICLHIVYTNTIYSGARPVVSYIVLMTVVSYTVLMTVVRTDVTLRHDNMTTPHSTGQLDMTVTLRHDGYS